MAIDRKDRQARREFFAATLSRLLDRHSSKESRRALCQRLGFGEQTYNWLRKITSEGISHVRGEERKKVLEAICGELGVKLHELWPQPPQPEPPQWGTPKLDEIIALGILEHSRRKGGCSPHELVERVEWVCAELASATVRRVVDAAYNQPEKYYLNITRPAQITAYSMPDEPEHVVKMEDWEEENS